MSKPIQSTQDYFPFGSLLPGRGVDQAEYKYGFNSKENDNEVYGDANFQDYGMRMYDTRVGRFVSVDPITKDYPELTPYQFASNMAIWAIDIDGLEAWRATNKAENVFSVKDWQHFVVAELKRISSEGIKFECTDLATFLMARYYFVKGVELTYYNPVTKETISSNDPSWGNYVNGEEEGFNMFFWGFKNATGEDAYNKYHEGGGQARNALANAFGAGNVGELGKGIAESEIQLGDYGSTGKHTRVSVKNGGFWNYPLTEADNFTGGPETDAALFVSGSQLS